MMSSSLMLVFIFVMADIGFSFRSFQVLGVDHTWGPNYNGQYFDFAAHNVDKYLGRTNWDNQIFTAHVQRLKKQIQVRLWRRASTHPYGPDIGSAMGRVEPYGSKKSSDWRVGDVITIIRGSVSFKVLGVDHTWGVNGQWFDFAAQDVDTYLGRTNWDLQVFTAYVHRLRAPVQVRLRRRASTHPYGPAIGSAMGRVEPYGSRKSSDWRVDDVITLTRGSGSFQVFRVLGVDHAWCPNYNGQYFDFAANDVDTYLGRTNWNNQIFTVYVHRLQAPVQVRLWRRASTHPYGPAIGSAMGRVEPFKKSSGWRVGDVITLTRGTVTVLRTGAYFTFDIATVDAALGRIDWDNELFMLYNYRSKQTAEVILWRRGPGGNGGSNGYGRKQPRATMKSYDWKVGDVLVIFDDVAPFSPSYSHSIGNEAFYYAWGAYCDRSIINSWTNGLAAGPDEVKQFQLYKVITTSDGALQAYIGYDAARKRILMSFRGTEMDSIYANFDIAPTRYREAFVNGIIDAKVHPAFYGGLKNLGIAGLDAAIGEMSKKHLGSDWLITGHSLGAAMGAIAALELKKSPKYSRLNIGNVDVVSFGMPRTFSPPVAGIFNDVIRSHWRIVNRYDIVTTVPIKSKGYYHVGTEVWYYWQPKDKIASNDFSLSFKVCNGPSEDKECFSTDVDGHGMGILISPGLAYHTNYFALDSSSMCKSTRRRLGESPLMNE